MNMKVEILGLILFAVLFMGCVDLDVTLPYEDYEDYEYDYDYDYEYEYEYDYDYGYETDEEEREEYEYDYDYGMKEIVVPQGGIVYCVFDYPDGKMEYYFAENQAVLKQTNHMGDWTKTFISREEMCTEQYWYDDYYESGGTSNVDCTPFTSENQCMEEIERLKSSASIVGTCSEMEYDSKHFEFTE